MSAGSGPFGAGTPVTTEAPPTGAAGSRYINPATKDYEQDARSKQLAQMPAVRQQFLLVLTTILASSTTLQRFGIGAPRKMGDSFETEMKQEIVRRSAHITELQRAARIDNIKVEKGSGGRARITLSYTPTDGTRGQTIEVE